MKAMTAKTLMVRAPRRRSESVIVTATIFADLGVSVTPFKARTCPTTPS
jgi:hypothetical protein